jgi:tRNA(fMet)-specific endonuclease VapC
MYLLDTNICVYVIRRRPEAVYRRLSGAAGGAAAISVVTAFELEIGAIGTSGAQGQHYSEAVRLFIAEFPVLPLEDSARAAYGQLRTALERRGEKIGAHDMLIAAHALALGAILVTNNEKEFKRIKGLSIENWAA